MRFLRPSSSSKNSSQSVTTTTAFAKKNQILHILTIMNEHEKLVKLKTASSMHYHTACLSEHEYKHVKSQTPKKMPTTTQSDWATKRNIHAEVFSKFAESMNEILIEKGGVKSLTDIHATYKGMFEEATFKLKSNQSESAFLPQHLLKKLLERFPALTKTVYKNRTYVHRDDICLKNISIGIDALDLETQIKSVAFQIRKEVMSMNKRDLPKQNITLDDILGGECETPKLLKLLIECLINGPNGTKSERKIRRTECISQSIIYSMSNGAIKPSTCLYLGLATKSMTGSRQMVDILNRMGYSISYTAVEELETELAFGGSLQKRVLPNGLIAHYPELRTHLAFDNYDRYVETASGKDTLHETVGIVYQNVADNAQTINIRSCPETLTEERVVEQSNTRRRRKYQSSFNVEIDPYYRGNKIAPSLIGSQPTLPTSLGDAVKMNNIWMFHHALSTSNNKRWFAWNSARTVDINPTQKIGYLPTINMSPTSDSVVKKNFTDSAECS